MIESLSFRTLVEGNYSGSKEETCDKGKQEPHEEQENEKKKREEKEVLQA